MRTGVLTQKLGMTRLYSENGSVVPLTLLSVKDCYVVDVKTEERDGYVAVQLGTALTKPQRLNNAQKQVLIKKELPALRILQECRVSDDAVLPVGEQLRAEHFVVGQFVDVTATTKGKGFAGAMKRHNFGGLRATHGVSLTHRSHGSTGHREFPGKVFKNKRMAGQMGNTQVTQQSLRVLVIDTENQLIGVQGCVPGANKGWVLVRDATKKIMPADLPYPTAKVLQVASADQVINPIAVEDNASLPETTEIVSE
ncbi:MAG: 50S ribosomal protein L3 [Alphaproteobacteria bacterium]|nr:50S ribosomal protein L3 [Alphaproteobacteria bacterium]